MFGLSERGKECEIVGQRGVCLSFLKSQCSQPSVYLPFLERFCERRARQQQFLEREQVGQEVPGSGHGVNDSTRVERSEGIPDVKSGGKFASVCRELTWKESEDKMIGLVFKLEGNLRSRRTSCQSMQSEVAPEE